MAPTTAAPTTAGATTTTAGAETTTAPADTATADKWHASPKDHRGANGQKFDYSCPPNGVTGSVWGSEIYTDDSSVCNAAVQVGLITFAKGGDVTVEMLEGKDLYQGADANGVSSTDYGKYDGSFHFPAVEPDSVEFDAGPQSWSRNGGAFGGVEGDTFTVPCDSNGTAGSVWGSGPYTVDSSICTAAVHAGLITLAKGGQVTYEIVAGADSYKGTTAHGITTTEYGPFRASITFPANQGGEGG